MDFNMLNLITMIVALAAIYTAYSYLRKYEDSKRSSGQLISSYKERLKEQEEEFKLNMDNTIASYEEDIKRLKKQMHYNPVVSEILRQRRDLLTNRKKPEKFIISHDLYVQISSICEAVNNSDIFDNSFNEKKFILGMHFEIVYDKDFYIKVY